MRESERVRESERDIETVRETERERDRQTERICRRLYKCIAILPSILSVGYIYSLRRIITRCVSKGKKHLGSQLV